MKFLAKVFEEIRMMYTVHLRIAGVIMFFIPAVYTLIFGGLFYRNTLTNVPIIVCNLNDGFRSQGLIRDLYDAPEVAIKFVQTSPMDFERAIIHEKVSGIVVIPKDYSKNVLSGKASVIELIVDNKNTVLSGTASRAVQSVVGAHNSSTVVNRRMAAGGSSAQAQGALNLSSRMLYNPTGGYIDFFLLPLIVHSGQIAIVFTMAPSFSPKKNIAGGNCWKVRSQSSPRNNVPRADIRRVHDGVRVVRGRVGQYPAESDNLAAVLYYAVGLVQRSDLAAHVEDDWRSSRRVRRRACKMIRR